MRTLYHLHLDPICRIIRILMGEQKLEFQLHYERVWDERDDFFSLNPGGEVPVLVDQNGSSIVSFYAIIRYLEDMYPDQSSDQTNPLFMSEVWRLVDWFNGKFSREVTSKLVFEKIYKRHILKGYPDSKNIREAQHDIHAHMDYLCYLIDRRKWIAGETLSIADFTAAAHLSCLDFVGNVPWDKYPEAKEWYMLLKSRPSFRALLQDQVPGHQAVEHYAVLDF